MQNLAARNLAARNLAARNLAAQVESVCELIRSGCSIQPRVGIILGTGLGGLAEQIVPQKQIPFEEIPHFGVSTALGHRGQLICGHLDSVPVIALQGRLHLYGGYSTQQVTLPVRVMKRLGAQLLVVSNASGGLNPAYASGDIMVIEDHINLMWRNPLIGRNDEQLGPRFPDMSRPYDRLLMATAIETGRAHRFRCHQGVYAAMSGPTYETRAEYRMLRHLGADVVGMSTVPEVIVAVHAGMKVLGLSAVTNLCRPDRLKSTDGHEVEAAAEAAEPKMRQIVKAIVADLG